MTGSSTARISFVVGALLSLAGLLAPSARAEFGPIELVSKSATEQADLAEAPALSADGRFVAFAGHLGGRTGVFVKDLQTGSVRLVAENASRPSISEDGRYVAFTTAGRLDPANDQASNSIDVYVADMSTTKPTYELASAADGREGQALSGGSLAAGRVALSADGREAAFVNQGEVYVRDRATAETILISVRRDPLTGATESEVAVEDGGAYQPAGAAISGDGSTVAWVGRRLPEQVPMLSDEEATVRRLEETKGSESASAEYHEPLWRRVPTPLEPDPPTRRVVGGGDPLALGCPPDGTLAEPACQGPFPNTLDERAVENTRQEGRGWGISLPHLSRDGNEVALIANPDEGKDLYLVDMAPGLSRRQALRRLTQWVNVAPEAPDPPEWFGPPELSGDIEECAISPDGERIAFTTRRQVFPLSSPILVTPVPPVLGEAELYQLDLATETIERVTPGPGAAASLGTGSGAASPSYDEDGTRLALASGAYNLVAGDTNEASDVFVVDSPPAAPVEETRISARPAQISVRPLWRMTVSATSLRNGGVRVVIGLPGAGTVRVKGRARLGRRLKLRRVSSALRRADAGGTQRLILRLPRKLRPLAHHKGGLDAELDVDFAPTEGKRLSSAVDVRFLVHRRKGRKR